MAQIRNLVIDQGSAYSVTIVLSDAAGTPLVVSGYTHAAQIRRSYAATTAVNFTTATTATVGELTLSLTAAQTTALKQCRYVYDVVLTSAGVPIRVLEGIVTVTPGVTR